MKYCVKCGKQMDDGTIVCEACGAIQPEPRPVNGNPQFQNPPVQNYNQPTYPQHFQTGIYPPVRPSNTGYLVWSIILTFFCTPLGVAGIVFAALAGSATTYAEAVSKLKISKIFCIIGTCLIALTIIAYIIFFAAAMMTTVTSARFD